jgi:hypothetical protein
VQTKLAVAKRLRQIRVSRICVFLPFGGETASAAVSTVASTLAAAALEYFAALMPLQGRKLEGPTADVAQTSHGGIKMKSVHGLVILGKGFSAS